MFAKPQKFVSNIGRPANVDADVVEISNYNKYESRMKFKIITRLGKKYFDCLMMYSLPLKVGDRITGPAVLDGNTVVFTDIPFITNLVTKEGFIQTIKAQFRYLSHINVVKFHDWLECKGKDRELSGPAVLNEIAEDFHRTRDEGIVEDIAKILNTKDSNVVKLLRWWHADFNVRRLQLMGLTKKEIRSLQYSVEDCMSILRYNPYLFIKLPIEKCDKLVDQLNVKLPDGARRCGEIARILLKHVNQNKWTCTPLNMLFTEAPDAGTHLAELKSELFPDNKDGKRGYGCVVEYDCIYLPYQYEVEKETSDFLRDLNKQPIEIKREPTFPEKEPIIPDESQMEALRSALNNRVSCITGNAGSGKTTLVKWLIYNLDLLNIKFIICSFTGKAVERLRKVTKDTRVMTIHSSLRYKDPFSCLIIDETSMVETQLLHMQLNRFRDRINHIIFIGDDKQLLPINWGCLYTALLGSRIPNAMLTTQHRVDNDFIGQNLQRIISKKYVVQHDSFKLIDGSDEDIYAHVMALHEKGQEVTVISPYNAEVLEINNKIRNIVNKNGVSVVDHNHREWRVGDRVMMTKNCHDAGVMNGEEGKVVGVDMGSITVLFGEKKHTFPFVNPQYDDDNEDDDDSANNDASELSTNLLQLCWCITCHKSQGSEWKHGIIYMPQRSFASGNFLCNNLIYTGTSRFKESLAVIGNIKVYQAAITKDASIRFDNTQKRLDL